MAEGGLSWVLSGPVGKLAPGEMSQAWPDQTEPFSLNVISRIKRGGDLGLFCAICPPANTNPGTPSRSLSQTWESRLTPRTPGSVGALGAGH